MSHQYAAHKVSQNIMHMYKRFLNIEQGFFAEKLAELIVGRHKGSTCDVFIARTNDVLNPVFQPEILTAKRYRSLGYH